MQGPPGPPGPPRPNKLTDFRPDSDSERPRKGEAPHLLQGSPGPPGPPRPKQLTDFRPDSDSEVVSVNGLARKLTAPGSNTSAATTNSIRKNRPDVRRRRLGTNEHIHIYILYFVGDLKSLKSLSPNRPLGPRNEAPSHSERFPGRPNKNKMCRNVKHG